MFEFLNQTPFDRRFFLIGVHFTGRQFRPSVDGEIDYFPRGFGRPGHRIDPETRDVIIRASRAFDLEWALVMMVLFGLVSALAVGLPWFYPLTVPWPPTVELVATAMLAAYLIWIPAWVIGLRGLRRLTDQLLKGVPVVSLSQAEYRRLIVQSWLDLPRGMKFSKFLSGLFYLVILMAALRTSNSINAWIPAVLAAYVAMGLIQFAIEATRAQIWSRALR